MKKINPKEEWRDVKSYEGYYQVSNLGRVRSLDRCVKDDYHISRILKGKIRTLFTRPDKRIQLSLHKGNKRERADIHKLVAEAFVHKPKGRLEINHVDGNPSNNRADNLEWITRSENQKHAYRLGLKKALRGEQNKCSKLNNWQVQRIRLMKEVTPKITTRKIANFFDVSKTSIIYIFNRKTWTHI
jgi:hypothetical protein